jgi:rod shape-determining protein MreB
MLLADFTMAEHQLKGGIKKLRQSILSPNILIHPMELTDGGLTQVELRAFRELGLGVGGSKVATWEGAVLKGAAVSKAISEYKY